MNSNEAPEWRTTDTTTDPASDAEVESRIRDIEDTRGELTRTADELGRRLDPATIASNVTQTARDAAVGKVESMANSAGDMVTDVGTQARETGTGIIDTMKRNPIPTALAGLGIGWLWMSRSTTPTRPVRIVGEGNGRTEPGLTDRVEQAGRDVGQAASDAVASVGDRAGDAADAAGRSMQSVGRTAEDVAGDARRTAQDVGETATRIIGENPLAAGAIALAVGTAVGLAIPATRTERRIVGEAGSDVLDQAQQALAQPLEKAERELRDSETSATLTGASS